MEAPLPGLPETISDAFPAISRVRPPLANLAKEWAHQHMHSRSERGLKPTYQLSIDYLLHELWPTTDQASHFSQ